MRFPAYEQAMSGFIPFHHKTTRPRVHLVHHLTSQPVRNPGRDATHPELVVGVRHGPGDAVDIRGRHQLVPVGGVARAAHQPGKRLVRRQIPPVTRQRGADGVPTHIVRDLHHEIVIEPRRVGVEVVVDVYTDTLHRQLRLTRHYRRSPELVFLS